MTVTTPQGIWVVPPFRGVWTSSVTKHKIVASEYLSLRSLYISLEAAHDLPAQCRVVSVPPLHKELILYAAEFPIDYHQNSPEERIMAAIS
jgi:hypothetical protein